MLDVKYINNINWEINDSYQNYRFLKNAYYKADIRFIYNTYWKGAAGNVGRHSIVLTNIRKHQDDKYVESQKDDKVYDNVKIGRAKIHRFNGSKVDLSIIKKYIDTKFNIDCDITVEFRTNIHCKFDALFINIKLSKSSDDIAMVLGSSCKLNIKNTYNDSLPKAKRRESFYINDSPDVHRIRDELELEVKDYINQWTLLEKEAKCLTGIKLKYINKSSKGENLYAFVIDNPQTYTNLLVELQGYNTGLERLTVQQSQEHNNGNGNGKLIRLACDTLEVSELVKYKYYIVNVKFYKDKYPYIDEIAPYQAPIVSEFIDEDD